MTETAQTGSPSRLVTPLTILLVEDSELDATLVSEMLAHARGLSATIIRHDRLENGWATWPKAASISCCST